VRRQGGVESRIVDEAGSESEDGEVWERMASAVLKRRESVNRTERTERSIGFEKPVRDGLLNEKLRNQRPVVEVVPSRLQTGFDEVRRWHREASGRRRRVVSHQPLDE
jgi:hypothetical protein